MDSFLVSPLTKELRFGRGTCFFYGWVWLLLLLLLLLAAYSTIILAARLLPLLNISYLPHSLSPYNIIVKLLNISYTYFNFKINPSLHSTLSPPLTLTHSPLYLSLISSQISYVTEKNRFDCFLLFFASRCTYLFIYIIISMYFFIERKERERECLRCKEREREREREKITMIYFDLFFLSQIYIYIYIYISHTHPNDRSIYR